MLRGLRGKYTAVCGRPAGACTTSFLAVVGAPNASVDLRCAQVRAWFRFWGTPSKKEKDQIEEDWQAHRQRAQDMLPHKAAQGPLGGILALLLGVGWDPVSAREWVDPAGLCWMLGGGPGDIEAFTAHVAQTLCGEQWEEPSKHYLGKGLGNGAFATQIWQHIARLRRKGEVMEAGLNGTNSSGSFWPKDRQLAAGYALDNLLCPMGCG